LFRKVGEIMELFVGEYDVIVIGGGHAGCEAALASSKMGYSTAMFATNLDNIAMLACNPSIGGTSKGPSGSGSRCIGRTDGA
jgi:tRNA uridine 5-carboxymethylaminomethyl modification enzyme